jgi:hypothetical protein
MKYGMKTMAAMTMAALCGGANAGEAQTSATAGSARGNGTAAATARYEGDAGFARTDTRSGRVNLARGVAVGVDEDGLSLSLSNAVATEHGPAIATNFNLSIGRDGQVSHSNGIAVADGPVHRSATAGGSASNDRFNSGASSFASGRTDPRGVVRAETRSESGRPGLLPFRGERPEPGLVRVIRRVGRGLRHR